MKKKYSTRILNVKHVLGTVLNLWILLTDASDLSVDFGVWEHFKPDACMISDHDHCTGVKTVNKRAKANDTANKSSRGSPRILNNCDGNAFLGILQNNECLIKATLPPQLWKRIRDKQVIAGMPYRNRRRKRHKFHHFLSSHYKKKYPESSKRQV